MRTLSNHLLSWILPVIALAGICMSVSSCDTKELKDGSEFMLFYPDISNIGPTSVISIPVSHRGATPSDFEITEVTLDGNPVDVSASFIIDPETGDISIENTENLAIGDYYISVACNAGGSYRTFDNIIKVHMMRGVPESIVISPNVLDVKLADLMNPVAELPTAQIHSEGEHVKIKGYYAGAVKRDGVEIKEYQNLIKVDEKTGLVKIRHTGDMEIVPGKYTVDFRLTTAIVGKDAEEGLFADALTIEITSAPLALEYRPEKGIIEAGYPFESTAPELIGSDRGLKYSMSVFPDCDQLQIDENTGIITCPEGNTLNVGDKFTISIEAENIYGSRIFEEVYNIEVVDFIQPIEKVVYPNVEKIVQTCSFENSVSEKIGDNIIYSLEQVDEKDPNYPMIQELKIDQVSGKISAVKGNEIPTGTYTVTVLAENSKNKGNPFKTTFTVEIVTNPNMFSQMSWGNNLGLTPEENYASQYSLDKDVVDKFIPCKNDIADGIKRTFTIEKSSPTMRNKISIDPKTGDITVSYDAKRQLGVAMVTVKVGEDGDEAQIIKRIPFFVRNNVNAKNGYRVDYSPFAICVNPLKGDKKSLHSNAPTVYNKEGQKVEDLSKFAIDFRKDFYYWNANGPAEHMSGQLNAKDFTETERAKLFIYSIWQEYFGEKPNTGSREPVSYWHNYDKSDWKEQLEQRACYFNNEDYKLVVNPNKFRNDYGPANGVFFGKVTFLTTHDDPQDGIECHPIAIWFDKKFE